MFLDDDEDEEGSELEGHERSEFREHGGLSGGGVAGAMDNDYLFLHLDEPRQGKYWPAWISCSKLGER